MKDAGMSAPGSRGRAPAGRKFRGEELQVPRYSHPAAGASGEEAREGAYESHPAAADDVGEGIWFW